MERSKAEKIVLLGFLKINSGIQRLGMIFGGTINGKKSSTLKKMIRISFFLL